jgi:hypothetical protein
VAIKRKKSDDSKDAQTTLVTMDAAWAELHPQSIHLLNEEVLAWENLPLAIVLASAPSQLNRHAEDVNTQWT